MKVLTMIWSNLWKLVKKSSQSMENLWKANLIWKLLRLFETPGILILWIYWWRMYGRKQKIDLVVHYYKAINKLETSNLFNKNSIYVTKLRTMEANGLTFLVKIRVWHACMLYYLDEIRQLFCQPFYILSFIHPKLYIPSPIDTKEKLCLKIGIFWHKGMIWIN